MLRSIDIKNVAVIENVSIEFFEGMTVLTGETGAGKSIIIDAVNLILGARTNKALVRHGAEKAFVSACFDMPGGLREKLEGLGIETEEDSIIISRELSREGKSVARINGVMVTANVLRETADMLVNIHGQQDNQAILDSTRHAEFLDEYAGTGKVLEEYGKKLAQRKELLNSIKNLRINEEERLKRIDMLEYQTGEIEKADLKPGEKDSLLEERTVIVNSAKISEGICRAYSALYDNGAASAYDGVSTAEKALEDIAEYDKEIAELHSRLADVRYALEDIVHELNGYETEYDENYLNDIEERLDTINKLEKKYGGSITAVLDFLENASEELENIKNSDETIVKLEADLEKRTAELRNLGERLFLMRKKAGEEIAQAIQKELLELDMEKAVFKVFAEHTEKFFANGMDNVEFLISANPGEPPKPLAKVASGGELSRTMLAIKTVLAKTQSADTLIFDEIDTGVSGKAAQKIAAKLWRLARNNQVICISHQPQLAAFADNHYYIEKEVSKDAARTIVRILDDEERKAEVARIIDGADITDTALTHAAEMIAAASAKKEQEE